ncbi:MAG: transcriptional regulator [Maribacter sp.]|nr:MAG: transcriptional regulator [Maribacter sp.]
MKEFDSIKDCPLRRTIKALGGKWNLIIIKSIGEQELRFNEIRKQIPDISEKVLIDKLKILAKYHILIRKNFNEVPPKVSYKLSERGLEALTIVEHLEVFGETLASEGDEE